MINSHLLRGLFMELNSFLNKSSIQDFFNIRVNQTFTTTNHLIPSTDNVYSTLCTLRGV